MSVPPLLAIGTGVGLAALAGTLATRYDQSTVAAYILTGVSLGVVVPLLPWQAHLAGLREVVIDGGIVLLLFSLGLHVDAHELVADARLATALGSIDFAINFTAGALVGLAFGFGPLGSLAMAGIVYASSSALVTRALAQQGWLEAPEAAPIVRSLVVEDVVVGVYLTVLTALAARGGSTLAGVLGALQGLAFLAVVAALGWYGTGTLSRLLATASTEALLLRVLAVTTLVAGGAQALGVSAGVAAFVVGAVVDETPHDDRVERVARPLRSLFDVGLFVAIGAGVEPAAVFGVLDLLVAALAVSVGGKLVTGWLAGRLYDLPRRGSLRVGLGLLARGEFSMIIATLTASAGVPGAAGILPPFAVAYVLVTSVLGASLLHNESRLVAAIPGFE
ncbi:cation:proton antiporter [Haloarchaeobius amylolyticus]|uniref:cation:proton antiporter n=1 Tax=Haloarchaeobius amylolyticus TaxID=1198296 RepID=UPI00226DE2A2